MLLGREQQRTSFLSFFCVDVKLHANAEGVVLPIAVVASVLFLRLQDVHWVLAACGGQQGAQRPAAEGSGGQGTAAAGDKLGVGDGLHVDARR